MILEFAVENFRSIKDRQVFSMIAEPSKAKGENVFEVPLANGSSIRLLKTAVIYGANASGKSNLIKALGSLVQIVKNRIEGAGRPIKEYNPFIFSEETQNQPTTLQLTFLFNEIKFIYKILLYVSHIEEETLIYYPKGQPQSVFSRNGIASNLIHQANLGKNFGNKNIKVFRNQSLLNKFGTDQPHDFLSQIYSYISELGVLDSMNSISNKHGIQVLSEYFSQQSQQNTLKRLEKLIQAADTKISSLSFATKEEDFFEQYSPKMGIGVKTDLTQSNNLNKLFGVHKIYDRGKEIGFRKLDLEEESEGTQALIWRGGLILDKLESGGLLVLDELDNSLHPKLVKFLVKLFSRSRSNPHNAQLIFATHEVTLLDRDLFRTDQIWITEKNEFGETELYSVQDFEGVREDIPFDKWYMAGKFGGQPNIEDIESIFSNE